MGKRTGVFAGWAVLGTVLTFGGFYVFTPFGLMTVAVVVALGLLIPRIEGHRMPEMLGLACGPGVFFIVIASETGDPALAIGGGSAMVTLVICAYALVLRSWSRQRQA